MLKKMFVFMLSVLSFCCGPQVAAAVPQALTGIFAHGLGGSAAQIEQYAEIFGPLIGRNGPEWDRELHGAKAGPQQSCLAQQGDIDVIVGQMAERVGETSMLVGVSKGGATMFNTIGYCAEHRPELLVGLRAAIFDCPFKNPESVAKQIVHTAAVQVRRRGGWFSGSSASSMETSADSSMAPSCFRGATSVAYKNYDRSGATPEKALEQWALPIVNREMVVVFIHSRADELISVNDSRYLYRELLRIGYRNVYLIEVEHGEHAAELWGADSGFIYSCLRAIYERHGFALSGVLRDAMPLEDLAMAQPTIEQVAERMAAGGRK